MNATIAIPVEGDNIFPHFGKAAKFRIYKIEGDAVVSTDESEPQEGTAHEEVAFWLLTRGVNAVICGNIGPGAQGALMAAGILALAGVEGAADEAVAKLIDGSLEALRNLANCAHHGGGCGGHCGGGSCGCGGGSCGHGCCH